MIRAEPALRLAGPLRPEDRLMDIRIVVPGLPIATPDPFAVGLGGSETAGLQLGRAFARKGHQVIVFCGVERPTRWQDARLVPPEAHEPPGLRMPPVSTAALLVDADEPV